MYLAGVYLKEQQASPKPVLAGYQEVRICGVRQNKYFGKVEERTVTWDQAMTLRIGEEKPSKELKKDVSSLRTPDKERHPLSKARNKQVTGPQGKEGCGVEGEDMTEL